MGGLSGVLMTFAPARNGFRGPLLACAKVINTPGRLRRLDWLFRPDSAPTTNPISEFRVSRSLIETEAPTDSPPIEDSVIHEGRSRKNPSEIPKKYSPPVVAQPIFDSHAQLRDLAAR